MPEEFVLLALIAGFILALSAAAVFRLSRKNRSLMKQVSCLQESIKALHEKPSEPVRDGVNGILKSEDHEAEIFQAQKLEALGQLAAGVAHDFNNILSIIDGYSRIAADKLADGSETKDYLLKIRKASERGANLTKQMLTFSRHKIVTETVIDLGKTVQDLETLLRPLVDASVNLFLRAAEENLFVAGTSDGIMQILMNLTVNGRDAMPHGGSLIIESRHVEFIDLPKSIREKNNAGGYACLCVSDTGHGMDQSIQKRIFDPFFTTKAQGKGTGLGLSTVYGLVKQMGGVIDVYSVPDQGTTMSVYLPLTDRRPEKQITGTPQDYKNFSLKGYTALIAEDEKELLFMVRDMLEKLGMKVITASNGNEALVRQDEYDGVIDLLLTDVVMPGLDGLRMAEMLHTLRPETRIIFMSGYPAMGSMARIELPKDAYFMAKPVQYETLLQLIYERLHEKNAVEGFSGYPPKTTPRWESGEALSKPGGQM